MPGPVADLEGNGMEIASVHERGNDACVGDAMVSHVVDGPLGMSEVMGGFEVPGPCACVLEV